MFRIWAKVYKDNKMIKNMVICNDDGNLRRTQKVFAAIDDICEEYDLAEPIWLDSNINDFKRNARTRFMQDNFIEPIEFDYLEIHVIEED